MYNVSRNGSITSEQYMYCAILQLLCTGSLDKGHDLVKKKSKVSEENTVDATFV